MKKLNCAYKFYAACNIYPMYFIMLQSRFREKKTAWFCSAGHTYATLNIPVMLHFKMTDGDRTSTTSNSKLVFTRRPLHTGGCSLNTQHHQYWLPFSSLLCPHISITVLHNIILNYNFKIKVHVSKLRL